MAFSHCPAHQFFPGPRGFEEGIFDDPRPGLPGGDGLGRNRIERPPRQPKSTFSYILKSTFSTFSCPKSTDNQVQPGYVFSFTYHVHYNFSLARIDKMGRAWTKSGGWKIFQKLTSGRGAIIRYSRVV